MSSTALSSAERQQAATAERAATAIFFLNGLVLGSWIPRLAELRDQLAIDEDVLGRALMGMGLGGLFGSLASGVLTNRFGSRTMTTSTGTAMMLVLPFVALSGNAWALFGALFALGFADAGADIGMNAQVVHAQELLGRSTINRVHAMWSVGTLVGGLVGTAASFLGAGMQHQLLGFAAFGLAAMFWAGPRLLPFDAPMAEEATSGRGSITAGALMLGAVGLATAVLEGSSSDWSALMLADERGASTDEAGLGFVVFAAAMLISRLIADNVIDAIGNRRTMIGGSVLVVLGLAVVIVAPNVPTTLIGYVITGIGVAPLFPLLYKAAAQSGDNSAGTGLAVMSAGMRVGFLGAPVIIGAIAAAANLRLAIGLVLGVAAVVSVANGLRQPKD